jgi:hypothetical protein
MSPVDRNVRLSRKIIVSVARQTHLPALRHTYHVEARYNRRIVSAERSRHGVMIVFDDGKSALFPAELLYAALSQVEGVVDGPGPEELEELAEG